MDTLHLFNETLEFLEDCEERYNFKALRYLPVGCNNRKEWNEKYSSDLYMTNVEEYDLHAKVEPLNRALSVSALPPFSPFSLKQPHWIASDWILDRNLLLCFVSFFLLTPFFFGCFRSLMLMPGSMGGEEITALTGLPLMCTRKGNNSRSMSWHTGHLVTVGTT